MPRKVIVPAEAVLATKWMVIWNGDWLDVREVHVRKWGDGPWQCIVVKGQPDLDKIMEGVGKGFIEERMHPTREQAVCEAIAEQDQIRREAEATAATAKAKIKLLMGQS